MSVINFATPSTGAPVDRDAWGAFLVPKEAIDSEISRLSAGVPNNGYRASSFVHPQAEDGIPSFTPVTEVVLNVLNPGERTPVRRGNYSLLETSILGGGRASVTTTHFPIQVNDVWTVPPMKPYYYENTTDQVWAWLSYSNAALLRRIGAYWAEDNLPIPEPVAVTESAPAVEQKYTRKNGPIHTLGSTGTELRSYEYLTDIEPVPNPPLHWTWSEVAPYLPIHPGDNSDPNKRGIWLLYNPATERRQGTTPVHFATYAAASPGTPPYAGKRGHFHTSASINYHRTGHGYSIVDGKRVDWKAGDLLFSAPSWLEHAHYVGQDGWTVLTVQDHPMQIALGSLLWQENPNDPILSLGNEEGQKGFVFPREAGK
jgi:gentisate 1,2-dioxygenase